MEKPSVEGRLASAGMFVRAHLDERLTLEAIAEVAGLSPFHFHRIFRVAFGENLSAYVVRHRLQRAARELRTTTRPIIDIALEYGYESPSAFGRAFMRAFDLTPSAYRAADKTLPLVPASVSPPPDIPEPRIEDYLDRGALALRIVGALSLSKTISPIALKPAWPDPARYESEETAARAAASKGAGCTNDSRST